MGFPITHSLEGTLEANDLCLRKNKLGTDKNHLHSYINEIYEPVFSILSSPESILEIGVQHKASLALWKIQFSDASVTGWDVDISQPTHPVAEELIESGKIKLVQKDAYQFLEEVPKDFSLIIDDGPHTLASQIKVLELRNNLNHDGILIIEDIGEYGGPRYCFYKLLKRLPINEWRYCLNIDLSEKKGRWDDAVFIYSKNAALLEVLRNRHGKYISSWQELFIYSLIWKLKNTLKAYFLYFKK